MTGSAHPLQNATIKLVTGLDCRTNAAPAGGVDWSRVKIIKGDKIRWFAADDMGNAERYALCAPAFRAELEGGIGGAGESLQLARTETKDEGAVFGFQHEVSQPVGVGVELDIQSLHGSGGLNLGELNCGGGYQVRDLDRVDGFEPKRSRPSIDRDSEYHGATIAADVDLIAGQYGHAQSPVGEGLDPTVADGGGEAITPAGGRQ